MRLIHKSGHDETQSCNTREAVPMAAVPADVKAIDSVACRIGLSRRKTTEPEAPDIATARYSPPSFPSFASVHLQRFGFPVRVFRVAMPGAKPTFGFGFRG